MAPTNNDDPPKRRTRKLVRDRIPEILQRQKKRFESRVLADSDKQLELRRKLMEENFELLEALLTGRSDEILSETADVLEVLLALLESSGYTLDDLVRRREERRKERGGFDRGAFLEWVEYHGTSREPTKITPTFLFQNSLSPKRRLSVLDVITSELEKACDAAFASAFYSRGIRNLLLDPLNQLLSRGRLRLLLSTMGNHASPADLRHLREYLPKAELRIYHPPSIPLSTSPSPFHAKAYLFRHESDRGAVVIGSSNFTEAGFSTNVEWNYYSNLEVNVPIDGETPFNQIWHEFDRVWNEESQEANEEFISAYELRWTPPPGVDDTVVASRTATYGIKPTPNEAQEEALAGLQELRAEGATKAVVIAATGIGKTYLAAFDFERMGGRSVLYIAHREEILTQAVGSFRKVLRDPSFGYVVAGRESLREHRNVFATVQTLGNQEVLNELERDAFDYIVVDECHHAVAETYSRIIRHFSPKMLLGITATPERLDGRDVLAFCEYNVAYELRLFDAIKRKLLVPFQYFAISDPVDYGNIRWTGAQYDEEELSEALADDTRTAILAHNLKKYLASDGSVRALAFCSSVSHARYTAQRLTTEHKIPAVALTGATKTEERKRAIDRLRDEKDPLQVICTVDLFNEGVDIPEITHLLLLRPTQSFTVFLQQLGRGLRHAPGKEFLVVIDFVGGYRNAYVTNLALRGYTSLKAALPGLRAKSSEIYSELPSGCFVRAETEVQRVWDTSFADISTKPSRRDQLRLAYREVRDALGDAVPSLTDFFANPLAFDPLPLSTEFKGWLRVLEACEESLPEEIARYLGTAAETFLYHIERNLSPARSYKGVTILSLLELEGTKWEVSAIAHHFKQYYVNHRSHLIDYPEMARSEDPSQYSLKKVERHLMDNPLNFLSNKSDDCFQLDKTARIFWIKPEFASYWLDSHFKGMVKDYTQYGLARYWDRKRRNGE